MKVFSIQVALLLLKKSCILADKLPHFGNHKIQDMEYDPEMVGKYHTDAFNNLEEKYKGSSSLPDSLSDAVKDMTIILNDYCPSNDSNQFDSCVRKVSQHTNTKYLDTIRKESVRKFLSNDKMKRAREIIGNMDSKQGTLDAINSLKQECDKKNIEERGVISALSVAEESYSLWYDVLNDESHSFNFRFQNGERKLQACVDLFSLVNADVLGAIEGYVTSGSFDAMIVESILFSLNRFFNGCDENFGDDDFDDDGRPSDDDRNNDDETDIEPNISPTAAPSITPTAKPSISPTAEPSISQTAEPSISPTAASSISPTASPSISPSVAPTTSPTVSKQTLDKEIPCIAVMDESYERASFYFNDKWLTFRAAYPDRPFCLLQPGDFIDFNDMQNYPYDDIDEATALSIPEIFYEDDNTKFHVVKRDIGDSSEASDWFELCDLEGLREDGITKVALFIDESESMSRDTVEASLAFFEDRLDVEGLEAEKIIFNDDEDWVSPFISDFGL